jgi:hypothetical protein
MIGFFKYFQGGNRIAADSYDRRLLVQQDLLVVSVCTGLFGSATGQGYRKKVHNQIPFSVIIFRSPQIAILIIGLKGWNRIADPERFSLPSCTID